VRIFKINFEIKNPDAKEGEDPWDRGWYFIEESVQDLQDWISEMYKEHGQDNIRHLEVLMANVAGWETVPVERRSDNTAGE